MFFEIKPHDGVYIAETSDASVPASYTPVKLLDETWFQNLVHYQRIYPGKVGPMNNNVQPKDAPSKIWPSLENAHCLSFIPKLAEQESDTFALIFTKEGMGEYNRIKRFIETGKV